jgi:ubiquitin-conjugating enzyme E2 M
VTELHITIFPNPERSIYRNSKITFGYTVSEKYPFEAPEVKCLNKILHPNIDKNGNVCLNLLRGGWKPIYELHLVIIGLLHLMENIKAADLEEPLDRDAAALMSKDINEYEKVVQETIKGKSYFGRQFDNIHFVPKNK